MSEEGASDVVYHVDEQGDIEVDDMINLEWPPRITNDRIASSPDTNEDILKEEYPEGLSRHGARYAQATFIEHPKSKNHRKWDILSGAYDFFVEGEEGLNRDRVPTHQVQCEWFLELVRKSEFEQAHSRFQSFFGTPTLEGAEEYREEHRPANANIFKVRCTDYVIRDMDLVEAHYFGTGLDNARRYWRGECGSTSPTCEVVMELPVEVVERVE